MSTRATIAATAVGLGSLRENPLRTVLSMLGVIIGVAALVSVISLGDVMQAFVRGELERTTDLQNLVVHAQTQRLVEGDWVPNHNYPVFTPHELADLNESLPLSRGGFMQIGGNARIVSQRTGKHRSVSVAATTFDASDDGRVKLAAGRLFTQSEATHNAPVIVLSYKLASELADGRGAESIVDETVRVRGLPRQVIGVFAFVKGERGYSAGVPYAAASNVFGSGVSLRTPQMIIKARAVEDIDAVRQGIQDWLATRYRDWQQSVEINTREQQLDQTAQAFSIMKLFLGALAGISLLVGGIGIMNIMLANVTERTREIGVRKAIGARGRDIQLQFLTETVAVSCVGSMLGIALGAIMTAGTVVGIRMWTKADGVSFVLSPSTVMLAVAAAVTIGLAFGTYPARRAAGLSPIDAIRHE
ncbi:MAG: ABC transporter permease [Gemmatimonadaceae bacterium]